MAQKQRATVCQPAKGRFSAMRDACDVKVNTREKLVELRLAARTLRPETKGSDADRKAAAVKGYKTWADTRERANARASR